MVPADCGVVPMCHDYVGRKNPIVHHVFHSKNTCSMAKTVGLFYAGTPNHFLLQLVQQRSGGGVR